MSKVSVHAYVTEESHESLFHYAEENGVSVSAIIQQWIYDLAEEVQASGTAEIRPEFITKIRRIDAERRRR